MIRVTHRIKEVIEKDVYGNPCFLLTDKKGGWFCQAATGSLSRFHGSVFLNKEMNPIKVIDSIGLVGTETTELVNEFHQVKRMSGVAKETFLLDENALLYDIAHFDGEAFLKLDVGPYYDYSDHGRGYEINMEDDVLIIEYFKGDKKFYVAIKTKAPYKKIEQWEKQYHEYDAKRNSPPHELYVYHALNFRINFDTRIVIAWSEDKEEAKIRARDIIANSETLRIIKKNYWLDVITPDQRITNPSIRMAYSCAKHSLESLVHQVGDTEGILAGLPWFHQVWTRDESISLKGLMLMERYDLVKDILIREISHLRNDGLIPNKFPGGARDKDSADGTGWVFSRLDDFISLLVRKNQLKQNIDPSEMKKIITKLEESIVNQIRHHTQNGSAYNKSQETWMDTIPRKGVRIEIQALRLRMYSLMKKLLKLAGKREEYEMYYRLEHEFQQRSKHLLWTGETLLDGLEHGPDKTIRPNTFIAGYLAPELLTKNEWIVTTKKNLPRLWCSWGGLSTLDKANPDFHAYYTGEDNKSYHNGDSWFWINNLAAITMHRTDKELFDAHIQNILAASAYDLLYGGFIGHASEVSSASQLESHGCWAQAWSAATFIELVHEYYGLG